jgi:type IV pilus assembly protein PilO
MLSDFRNIEYSDLGSAPAVVRYTLFTLLLIVLLVIGYFLIISDKWDQLERVKQQEFALRSDFEAKQQKAANLEAYEAQLEEMRELLETMFRQLPSKTEMDKLLVDVSQTALGAGIDVQLFAPQAEELRDFYAERPISVRMMGDYHQFGAFVGGVASLPRVVILTMNDISLRAATGRTADGRLVLEGQVKTYRYIDEEEAAGLAAEAPGP